MFTVKRGALAVAAAIIAFSSAAGLACGAAAANTAYSPVVVVIDAGHGGIDAGVRGKNSGVKESDINLAVARELAGCFKAAGFSAVMTRKSQAGLYGLPTKGFKLRDMKRRREIIEECGADMVISVHQNFYSDSARRGAQVFFRKEGMRRADPLVGDYFMLECTQSPSVIVECGFLSNAQDEELLLDGEYRHQLAYAIFCGAVEYLSSEG